MITEDGYSKDPDIIAEGVAITFGKEMMEDQGGIKEFLKGWRAVFEDENATWKHYCRNMPTRDVLYVYVIILNRLAYRCQFVGFDGPKPNEPRYKANGEGQSLDKSGILMCGPLKRCPFKRTLKGFQGFRYTTKLF